MQPDLLSVGPILWPKSAEGGGKHRSRSDVNQTSAASDNNRLKLRKVGQVWANAGRTLETDSAELMYLRSVVTSGTISVDPRSPSHLSLLLHDCPHWDPVPLGAPFCRWRWRTSICPM